MRQILLFSCKELPTLFTCKPGICFVLQCVLFHLNLIFKNISTLQTNNLTAFSVLAVMCPQTRSLDKLSRAKFTNIIIFSSRDVVNGFQVINKQFSLCKFGVTLVTIIVVVPFNVFIQLERCHKHF